MKFADLKYEDQLENISKMKFSDDSIELSVQLSEMTLVASKMISPVLREWLCEKIDYGIIKLKSLGSIIEAEAIDKRRNQIMPRKNFKPQSVS